jgi:hypothetical protein
MDIFAPPETKPDVLDVAYLLQAAPFIEKLEFHASNFIPNLKPFFFLRRLRLIRLDQTKGSTVSTPNMYKCLLDIHTEPEKNGSFHPLCPLLRVLTHPVQLWAVLMPSYEPC